MKLLIAFFIGSIIGWVIEVFYRKIFSQKKWMNPGFLTGPWLPIYGFGLVLLYLIFSTQVFDSNRSQIEVNFIKLITIIFSITLIELLGGLIFVKGLKIKLWDYSNNWGNFKGVICPRYSLYWAIIGAFYIFLLGNFVNNFLNFLSNLKFIQFILGTFFGLIIVDFFSSLELASRIRKLAREKQIVIHYQMFKEEVKLLPQRIKLSISDFNEKIIFKNLMIDEKRYDELAISGFIFSLFFFNVISFFISLMGLKSKNKKQFAIIGIILSLIETITLIIYFILII